MCLLYVYIDDIMVYSKNMTDHEKHLQRVFEAGWKLKPTKCAFGLEEVKLLGFILNKEGMINGSRKGTGYQRNVTT